MTDRALSEFDCIDVSVFALEPDENGRPVYSGFNAHAGRRYGALIDAMLGKTAAELFPGHFGLLSYSNHLATLSDGKKRSYQTVLPVLGEAFRSATTLIPQTASDGKVVRIIATSKEIGARATAAELQANAEFIGEEMEEFVSLAAHDLRAPIRNISQIAEILLEGFEDRGDGKRELIEMLGGVANTATSLISDVLAHAEASGVAEDVMEFHFGTLVAQIMDMLDPMRRVTWTASQGTILGDRAALQITLRNLIDNALKFAWPRDGEMERRLDLTLTGDKACFVVTMVDNGRGFSSEALDMLQGGALRPGAGFGLFGVRRLISRRGGMFLAENLARGARVRVSLPGSVQQEKPLTALRA